MNAHQMMQQAMKATGNTLPKGKSKIQAFKQDGSSITLNCKNVTTGNTVAEIMESAEEITSTETDPVEEGSDRTVSTTRPMAKSVAVEIYDNLQSQQVSQPVESAE